MRLTILNWIKSGASLQEGTRLFALQRGKDHPFLKLLQADPAGCLPVLIQELGNSVGLKPDEITLRPKLRDNWPFLNDPDCPAELKILAADKITAYYRYVQAHARLFDCVNLAEQRETMRDLMRNYQENRAIIAEFVYYKEHRSLLGKHPIFKWMNELKYLRKINPVQLVLKQQKIEHNIWRIESQLKSGKQPHLQTGREQRLMMKRMQLAELNRIISSHLK